MAQEQNYDHATDPELEELVYSIASLIGQLQQRLDKAESTNKYRICIQELDANNIPIQAVRYDEDGNEHWFANFYSVDLTIDLDDATVMSIGGLIKDLHAIQNPEG